ncbi:MAG: hypothetical protein U9Q33_13285 [Campylobacterota bacterium]|nr:hypothetical protein [Campylobacterota bacterium]
MRYIKTLLKLKEFGELNYSQVAKPLIDELKNESLIDIKTISKKRKKVVVKDQFYKVYSDIENIEQSTTRAQLVKTLADTKVKKISPQDGLYINGKCTIEAIELPLFNNSALFLKDIPKIEDDILVVCVENFENLIYFKSQLKYFQDDNILFVYRNSAMLEFIESIKNKIIYFGDFDLAGIFIFETQILSKNNNIEFFIPKDIEEIIIKHGSKELYKKQYNKYRDIKSKEENLQNLINIINKNQKVIEQEYFI